MGMSRHINKMTFVKNSKGNLTCRIDTYDKDGNKLYSRKLTYGEVYIVQPQNPQKLKHRDRLCEIIDLEEDHTGQVKVKFLDNKRVGKVDLNDLFEPPKPLQS